MTQFIRLMALSSVLTASLLAGCTTERQMEPKTKLKNVPDLTIMVDCGNCQVRSAIPESIHTAYVVAAAKAGVPISGDIQVTLKITNYTERGLVIRSISFVAGPLAFALKDEIKGIAILNGKQLPLEYQVHSPFSGIDAVAQKLGELSFDAIANLRETAVSGPPLSSNQNIASSDPTQLAPISN